MPEKYYDPQAIADLFNVKKITVWAWIRQGKLKASRIGGKLYRISQIQLDAFTQKYRTKG